MSNIIKLLILLAVVICILVLSILYFKKLYEVPEGDDFMGAEIIRIYTEEMPATRFIGKKYFMEDRENGSFSSKWGEWFQNGWFEIIEKQSDQDLSQWFVEGGAYIGLERLKENEPFEYYIGIFMPEGTPVPAGFEALDFPASLLGVGWIKGTMENIFIWEEIRDRLILEGYKPVADEQDALWSFERYTCPRFTDPDEDGNIILDYGYFLEFKP